MPAGISVAVEGEKVVVTRGGDEPDVRALHGLIRALLANAVSGVTAGFKRELDIVGVGYKAELKSPRELVLSLGFSHPVVYKAPEGVAISYDAKANRLTIEGIDKQKVGQVAAEIRAMRPPDRVQGQGCQVLGRGPEAQGRQVGSVAPWRKIRDRKQRRHRIHLRIRKVVAGTAERPRLVVFRSLSNVYAQLIDDAKGATLVAASTIEKDATQGRSSTAATRPPAAPSARRLRSVRRTKGSARWCSTGPASVTTVW